MKLRNIALKFGAAAALIATQAAHAAGGISDLTAAISFTDVVTAIFSIGVLVIGVDLAQLGYMKVRRLIKGAH